MNKAKFFEEMKACRVNASAHITIRGHKGGKTALIMSQSDAPNAFLSMHKDGSEAMQKAWAKYELWLKEYFETFDEEVLAEQIEAWECEREIRVMLKESDEVEALTEEEQKEVIEAFHRAALVMNEEIDQLSQELADRRCYWMSEESIHNAQQAAIARYKRRAFDGGRRRIAQHVLKVIVISKSLALKKTGYAEIEPEPTELVELQDCEIPF